MRKANLTQQPLISIERLSFSNSTGGLIAADIGLVSYFAPSAEVSLGSTDKEIESLSDSEKALLVRLTSLSPASALEGEGGVAGNVPVGKENPFAK